MLNNNNQSSKISKSVGIVKQGNPFVGLRSFEISETHLFFGRSNEVLELSDALMKEKFVALLGAEGSGKTSIINGGLLPLLSMRTQIGLTGSNEWHFIYCTLGKNPYHTLASELLLTFTDLNEDDQDFLNQLLVISTILKGSKYGLIEAIKTLNEEDKIEKNILLVVDQFEELFRFLDYSLKSREINEAFAFVSMLINTYEQKEQPIYQIISVKTDYTGFFAQYPSLAQMVNQSHYLLPSMSREQLRESIECPISVFGGKISEKLKQAILDEINDNPDQLPIFQHTLMRTWTYWVENGGHEVGEINLKHYNAIARVSNALSFHAEELYNKLDIHHRKTAELIFKNICNKGAHGTGQQKPVRIYELMQINRIDFEEVKMVVEHFRSEESGLLLPSFREELTKNSLVDIAHYRLVLTWERLEKWVEEEEFSIAMYLKLAENASDYQKGEGQLLIDADLEQAQIWLEKEKPLPEWGKRFHPAFERTLAFLKKSKIDNDFKKRKQTENQRKRLRNSRLISLLFGGLCLILLLLLIYGFIQNGEATEKAKIAELNEKQAILNEQQAKESAKKAQEAAKIVLQKKDSLDLAYEELSAAVAIAREQRIIAEKNVKQAKISEEEANKQSNIAMLAQIHAEEQKNNAEYEKRNAEKLNALATAKSMSIKALQLSDKQLKSLLVLHAYELNKKNGGPKADHDIYNGLHKAYLDFDISDVFVLNGHEGSVRKILSVKDDKMLTTSGDGKILEWETNSKEYKVLQDLGGSFVSNRAVDISPDEEYIISGNSSKYIYLIPLKSKASIYQRPLKVHSSRSWALKFIDNERFISAGADSTLCMVRGDDVFVIAKLPAKTNDIKIYSNKIYLALNNGSIQELTVNDNDYFIRELYRTPKNVAITALAVGENGDELAFGQEDGNIFIIDAEDRSGDNIKTEILHRLVGFNSYITELLYSNDYTMLVGASRNSEIRLWFRQNLKEQPMLLEEHESWVWSLAFGNKNEYLYSGDQSGKIYRFILNPDELANRLCDFVRRDITKDEWETYVGNQDFQEICVEDKSEKLSIKFYDFYE